MGRRACWLLLMAAFTVCLLAVGLPYWSIPYNRVQLPASLMGMGIVVVGVSSFMLRVWRVAPVWLVASGVGSSAPVAVMARVSADTALDPTSHNLWPLEVLIALTVGLFWAAGGAIAGMVVAWLIAASRRSVAQ